MSKKLTANMLLFALYNQLIHDLKVAKMSMIELYDKYREQVTDSAIEPNGKLSQYLHFQGNCSYVHVYEGTGVTLKDTIEISVGYYNEGGATIAEEICSIKPLIEKRKKIDSRDTIRDLKLLLENEMMENKWVTLFNVHDALKKVQEWHGGYLQTLQSLEDVSNATFYLQFQRSELNLVLTVNDEFSVTKVDVLLWHNRNLKFDATYYRQNTEWIYHDFNKRIEYTISNVNPLAQSIETINELVG